MIVLITVDVMILLLLAGLHFYWAFGGKYFKSSSIPATENGKMIFHPGFVITLLVASGLVLFALVVAGNTGIFDGFAQRKNFYYVTYAVAIIFFLRAVGDFKFVGLFKRIRGTSFAAKDTSIYSPLCLLISSLSFLIIFYSRAA